MVDTENVISNSSMVYVHPSLDGIYRKGRPGKFTYIDDKGKTVTNPKDLDRIKKLVLPPAWQNVWISPHARGYLQAVGVDAAGRKQYRYHHNWVNRRSDEKYYRLFDFGKTLPKARKIVERDLRGSKFDERKVLAICVRVLQHTLIRIGAPIYEKNYKSYGLSTLKDRHLKVNQNRVALCFVGKKGVKQEVVLTDKKLAKLIKQSKDIPGQDLFQFYTNSGDRKAVDSGAINQYIKEITGGDFTAKDFRTWGGTLEAMRQLAICTVQKPEISAKKAVVEALDCVAAKLGNTRSVCKKAYVYPELLVAFEKGSLQKYLKRIAMEKKDEREALKNDEKILMNFLKAHQNKFNEKS